MTNPSLEASRRMLLKAARSFYKKHSDLIKESHGIVHAEKVHHHTLRAIESLSTSTSTSTSTSSHSLASHPEQQPKEERSRPPLSQDQALEIEAAALLHDVDDDKYFPKAPALLETRNFLEQRNKDERIEHYGSLYPNAVSLLVKAGIPKSSHETILFMIDAVSCSKNGNSVPGRVTNKSGSDGFSLLIPRWSDRIEAVGARGVWRCYQYNREKDRPLDLPGVTPKPKSTEELWSHVVPERFEAYMKQQDGATEDPSMLGHYYDKLFHVACPPRDIVQNAYLEEKLKDSAKELVEVCLRYGRTGIVDEDYIRSFRDA